MPAAAGPHLPDLAKHRYPMGSTCDREHEMKSRVETLTPPNTPTPIGPYNHVAKVGEHIWIGGTAGVDPATGLLAGADVATQTKQTTKTAVT
jgi:enamine deaminase RidA (YjgF/YER057c/UK114 family)